MITKARSLYLGTLPNRCHLYSTQTQLLTDSRHTGFALQRDPSRMLVGTSCPCCRQIVVPPLVKPLQKVASTTVARLRANQPGALASPCFLFPSCVASPTSCESLNILHTIMMYSFSTVSLYPVQRPFVLRWDYAHLSRTMKLFLLVYSVELLLRQS